MIHPQGDGWVRGYDAKTGQKLWEFDANPKDSVWPKTRNELISTPVVYDGLVYIGNGQDPEHGEGVGHFYAIDPSKRGDITQSGKVWQFDKIRRTISTAAIKDGIVYIADFSGFLHALDAKTGSRVLEPRHAGGGVGLAGRRSTARSTSATRTATWWCCRPASRRSSWPRTPSAARSTRARCPPTARCSS